MKKLLLCGLVLSLMVCVVPVAALTAVDDYYYINLFAYAGNDVITNVLENDFPITPSLAIEITQSPIHGSAFVNSDGLLVYRPYSWGYQGLDSLKYRLYDGNEYSNEATVVYNLKGASVARDDWVSPLFNCPYGEWFYYDHYLLTNDGGNFDPSKITIEMTEPPKKGFAEIYPDGWFSYFGDPSYFGPMSFKYRLYDGQWYSNNATVHFDVVPYYETPSRVNFYTPIDTKLVVDNNDYLRIDGFDLGYLRYFVIISNPRYGIVTPKSCDENGQGCFDYMPNAGYWGLDSFVIQPWIYEGPACSEVPCTETTVTIFVGDPPSPLPGYTDPPTDPDGDGIYEDLNANNRLDFADVVLYFNQMTWIAANEPIAAFDLNGNSRIDFADIVALFNKI